MNVPHYICTYKSKYKELGSVHLYHKKAKRNTFIVFNKEFGKIISFSAVVAVADIELYYDHFFCEFKCVGEMQKSTAKTHMYICIL